jgi:arylsulfatase A-like enzyme
VRFGLGIVGPAGALAVGGHDGDFTTVLDVRVLDRVSGRALASLSLPIVVQDSRWLDYTLPVPGSPNGVRLVFEYRDALASTVVLVGKPRATTRAPARTTVLATVDALQRKNLSIYGYPRGTPGIDAVGRQGYVFTRAYSQANNTPTAVIALLNSRYPENAPWDGPRPDRPSLARFLSDRSVYTVLVTANAFLQEGHIAAGFDEVVYVSNRGRHTSEEVEAAMARVLRAHPGEDLFLYAHFLDPHAPYVPPLHTAGRYRRPSDALAEQMTANLDPWVYRPQHLEPGLNTNPVVPHAALSAAAVERVRDLYDEEVLDVDIHLGRVWDLMRQLRVYDDATVVVSADHGEELYEHGGVQHGGLGLYDEVVGVPLLVKLPRRHRLAVPRPGSRLRHIVQLVDLYPTIVEAMGFAPPPGLVGENLFRVERGYAISVWMLVPGWRRRSIVDGEYRLITGEERTEQAVRTDPPLLFHLPSDPDERVSVAEREPDRVRALEARMRAAIQADAAGAPAATNGTKDRAP